MKRLALLFCLTLLIADSIQADTLSISTFYPPPSAAYMRLRFVPDLTPPNPGLGQCANRDGLSWVDSTDGTFMFCWQNSVRPVITTWIQNGNSVYPSDAANNNLAVAIGPGLTVGARRLHVLENGMDVIQLESTAGGAAKMEFYENTINLRSKIAASAANALTIENNAGTTIFTARQTGGIGVGEPIPSTMLELRGSGAGVNRARMLVRSTDNEAGVSFMSDNTGEYLIYSPDSSDDLRFRFGANDWVYMLQNGDVGLGVTPTARFEIAADPINFVGTNTDVLRITTGNVGDLLMYNENGDLIVNYNPPPTPPDNEVVPGRGTIRAHAFFYNSDITLKENVRPASGLAAIMQLEGIRFKWKSTGRSDYGVSAQNVEEVFPELVSTNPVTHKKTVKYANLVGPLVEAIKEQQQQIQALQEDIEALRQSKKGR